MPPRPDAEESHQPPRKAPTSEDPLDPLMTTPGYTSPSPPREVSTRVRRPRPPVAAPEPCRAVAAPTAGLHFTPALMDKLRAKAVEFAFVTLNIGLDTFRPLDEGELANHHIHGEFFQITENSANMINQALREKRRVIAVGTSSTRALEAAAFRKEEDGRGWRVASRTDWTDIFIYPGHTFEIVRGMITNFHLPRSTTLAMTSAFGGKDLIMKAYNEAMVKDYRFFSFGDAMLIF